MFYKKMALSSLAAVTFAAPAMAQFAQGQGSIQRISSQNAAVNSSVAVSDINLNSEQIQSGENGFSGFQGQTSIQDVDSQNVAVDGSVAITDIDLNSHQEQQLSPAYYNYGSQDQTSIQSVYSENAAVNGSAAFTNTYLENQQVQFEDDSFYYPYLH
jgi:hypothetical protein